MQISEHLRAIWRGFHRFRRAYSALSADAPLTAIATTGEGVVGMAQVKKDGYAPRAFHPFFNGVWPLEPK